MRNAMNAQEVAVGWWPGDARYAKAAFYAYAHPAPEGFASATLSPSGAGVGNGSGGRYCPSGSSEAWRYPHRRKISNVLSRSLLILAEADGARGSAFVAIPSSFQINSREAFPTVITMLDLLLLHRTSARAMFARRKQL